MLHQLSLLFLGTLQVFSDLIIYKRNIKPPPSPGLTRARASKALRGTWANALPPGAPAGEEGTRWE